MTVRVYHTAADLFNDCVYFDLGEQSTGKRAIETRSHSPCAAASIRFYTGFLPLQKTIDDRLATDQLPTPVFTSYYQPFYFRKYEVSNAEYREFTGWVRDSVIRRMLAANGYEERYLLTDEQLYQAHRRDPGFDAERFLDSLKKLEQRPLNWKEKIEWDSEDPFYKAVLDKLFLSKEKSFFHRKETDPRKLVYQFEHTPAGYKADTIGIYPDTTRWTKDFSYFFQEPMENMYFWHPAYSNYPVVGLTYWQCLAFLEWKSKMLTQEMKRKGKNYQVVCALPSEREWDFASTAEQYEGQLQMLGEHYFTICDDSWLTDLRVASDTSRITRVYDGNTVDTTSVHPYTTDVIYSSSSKKKPKVVDAYSPNSNPYLDILHHDTRTSGDFISDYAFHTLPVDMREHSGAYGRRNKTVMRKSEQKRSMNERYLAHQDRQTGICFLDGNVSEWLREDLDSSWRPVYEKHRLLQQGPYYEQFLAAHTIENYYYRLLPAHGKLIRGCNWFDERYSSKYGKNTAGMNAKTFEDPDKPHCTVGFRYVIYVYPE